MKYDLNKFAAWQAEKPESRSIEIKIEASRYERLGGLSVWAYDYDLMQGQRVKRVEDIDIAGEQRKEDLQRLNELKAKYEGADA